MIAAATEQMTHEAALHEHVLHRGEHGAGLGEHGTVKCQ